MSSGVHGQSVLIESQLDSLDLPACTREELLPSDQPGAVLAEQQSPAVPVLSLFTAKLADQICPLISHYTQSFLQNLQEFHALETPALSPDAASINSLKNHACLLPLGSLAIIKTPLLQMPL